VELDDPHPSGRHVVEWTGLDRHDAGLEVAGGNGDGDTERVEQLRAATGALLADRSWPHVAREHIRIYQEVARAESPARRRLRAA